MRQFKTLALRSSATFALLCALSVSAQAQVIIDEDTNEQITTSTEGENGGPADVNIGEIDDEGNVVSAPVITIDSERTGVILDSNNALNLVAGSIVAEDINNVTGVELQGLQGGTDQSFTQTGNISLTEDFTPTDTDDDPFADGGLLLAKAAQAF